jgi:hypothetical protein
MRRLALRCGALAEESDQGPHLGQRPGRLLLHHAEHGDRSLRVGGRDRASGLGLDEDAGHVVRHRVVQLSGQLLTFANPDLLALPPPGVQPEAHRGP